MKKWPNKRNMVYIKIKVNQNTYDNFVTCTYILIQIPLVPYMKPIFKYF